VCLDKTGTLTDGEIVFARVVALDGDDGPGDDAAIGPVLGALADDENRNATAAALAAAHASPGWPRTGAVPFSSGRKWSAASFEGHATWVIGAPEMVLPDATSQDPVRVLADELAAEGLRVLLLARGTAPLPDGSNGDAVTLPSSLHPMALVCFEEQVRPDAAETIAYFVAQGVELKVISGDNPRTVAAVARRVGLSVDGDAFDARELPEDRDELAEVLEHHNVFGRVTPQQKRAMVAALQSRGHVVAMTGDGVNDALALKDADIGVAMGSGAPATRAVAELVLLDDKFASMPGVVAEGRRVIANIERSANLFVTKTVYAILIAAVVVILSWRYPFLPRHLTIVSTFTIGIPGFVLALEHTKRRYVPGFIQRVLRFCGPAGVVAGLASLVAYGLAYEVETLSLRQSRTTAALVLIAIALWVLVMASRPFVLWKGLLVGAMIGSVALILVVPGLSDFYALEMPPIRVLGEATLVAITAMLVMEIGWRATRRSFPAGLLRRFAGRGPDARSRGSDDGADQGAGAGGQGHREPAADQHA
jgi:cation-transporting ATPase E